MVFVCIIVVYFERTKHMLLEEKSGSETVEVMKVKWPYYEKCFFSLWQNHKIEFTKLNSGIKGLNYFMKSVKRFLSTHFI